MIYHERITINIVLMIPRPGAVGGKYAATVAMKLRDGSRQDACPTTGLCQQSDEADIPSGLEIYGYILGGCEICCRG